jgi:hypothetical protein
MEDEKVAVLACRVSHLKEKKNHCISVVRVQYYSWFVSKVKKIIILARN